MEGITTVVACAQACQADTNCFLEDGWVEQAFIHACEEVSECHLTILFFAMTLLSWFAPLFLLAA